MADQQTIGSKLIAAREPASTVARLARRLGVQTRTLSFGTRPDGQRSNRLLMLAGMLGVSATWLQGIGEGIGTPMTPTSNVSEPISLT